MILIDCDILKALPMQCERSCPGVHEQVVTPIYVLVMFAGKLTETEWPKVN